jgi:electron-transferring-flavoprotein dehydrogenase
VLTNSGVDEAWTTGVQLGESVIELLRAGKPFTRENLSKTYGGRRRASWVERGVHAAEHARVGFQYGVIRGLAGMALAGLTRGRLALHGEAAAPWMQLRQHPGKNETVTRQMASQLAIDDGRPLHDALLSVRGWPEIPYDGRLLVTHQDALLMGGKVQATPGFADHVLFRNRRLCAACEDKTCVAMCSGQAITLGADGLPVFEREKCVHCGACLWNCSQSVDGEHANIEFRAGSGGLHSAEN